ncbi:hypothetical protein OG730_41305 (plasmid) [Streptomyces sp. NBC_01298]|uniref:hypothetical protein n=1 Tax=Streptomyces sp. NBC_01298 TaxID=2903817 RepID=UPI002E13E2D2|nr:hypothetical protein OG730_42720 [Streptomyces sp. NBC_01298]WSK25907.1 hypothetical protein OG730_41305 [Streptomyces sp. NBC_01298]
MVLFHTYEELHGTVYVHRPTTATAGDDHRVREAWYGELMQQRRDEQRMNAGMPFVETITDLTVWPGRLDGLIPVEDVQPAHPGAGYAHSRTLDVFWPRLPGEKWLLLAAATRPHAHHLAASTSHDAMLHIIDLAFSLGVSLLPTLSEISNSDCPCRSRKRVCDHIAALIEYYARTLDHEPLTLLLLGGYAPTDFFALVDDPEHLSAQPYYRPESLPTPAADARDLYYRRQWHAAPPLPALPRPSPEPRGSASLPDLGDPGYQVLARGAATRAADLLSQALRRRRNPLVDPVGQLTPEQDATRLEAFGNPGKAAAPRG